MAAIYNTAAGESVSLKTINAGTLRLAKKSDETAWMADLTSVLNAIDDPMKVSELVAFHSGLSIDVIDRDLSGEAISSAQDAIVKIYEDFYPGLKGKLLKGIRKARAEAIMKIEILSQNASSTPESAESSPGDSVSAS